MRAVKGNKEYLIEESQKKGYQDRGYDIIDENGAVSAHGRRKTVPYDEYEKMVMENNALKEQLAALTAEEQKKAENLQEDSPAKEKTPGKSKTQG